MQKHVNLVDLVKSFLTSIYLQNLASIQPRTSLSKFCILEGQHIVFQYFGGIFNLHFEFFRNLHPGLRTRGQPRRSADGRQAADASLRRHEGPLIHCGKLRSANSFFFCSNLYKSRNSSEICFDEVKHISSEIDVSNLAKLR